MIAVVPAMLAPEWCFLAISLSAPATFMSSYPRVSRLSLVQSWTVASAKLMEEPPR